MQSRTRPARHRRNWSTWPRKRGYGPDTKAAEIVEWFKSDFGVGRGHAMAMVHVIKNGPGIGDKHVGTTGTHRDESNTLRLDGKANRT